MCASILPLRTETPRLSIFGAPGSNTNLGLDALMRGTMAAVTQHAPGASFTVFDNRLGVRAGNVRLGQAQTRFHFVGARLSRRVTRPESFMHMRASLLIRGWGNAGAAAVLASDAVLDVSGGDSFSDIYGAHRFRTVCASKHLAIAAGRPLVLLPQTYGPFRDRRAFARARSLVRAASQVWARDRDSFEALTELLGSSYDPARHHLGVDLAVLLEPLPSESLPAELRIAPTRGRPVGVNVSGLLWNYSERFDLRADYQQAMRLLVAALAQRGHPVVLVPHVLGRRRGGEADNVAALELWHSLALQHQQEVRVIEHFDDASQAKAVIAACEWFVGARMHATIAALSSGVPCAGIAYSPKFRGVFETLGAADAALDARILDTSSLVDAALESFDRRAEVQADLARCWPAVAARASEQMATVLQVVRAD